jgi:hypothetical protein
MVIASADEQLLLHVRDVRALEYLSIIVAFARQLHCICCPATSDDAYMRASADYKNTACSNQHYSLCVCYLGLGALEI